MRGAVLSDLPHDDGWDFAILVPQFAGLRADVADLVGMMPIGSANEALLAVLDKAVLGEPLPHGRVLAGACMVDPFFCGRRLLDRIAAAGVSGVVNLPSPGLHATGAYGLALNAADMGQAAEFQALGRARAAGLEPTAMVASVDQARMATDAGIEALILHPGLPSGEADIDARLADGVAATLSRIKAFAGPPRIALYRHPGFGPRLDETARQADDVVDWAIPAP